jgi:hypothetical protein
MILLLIGVCGDLRVDGTLSVVLALEPVSVYLDSPANKEFNHKRQPCTNMKNLIVPQVHIILHDHHGTLF